MAEGFSILLGRFEVTVPWVIDGDDYQIVGESVTLFSAMESLILTTSHQYSEIPVTALPAISLSRTWIELRAITIPLRICCGC